MDNELGLSAVMRSDSRVVTSEEEEVISLSYGWKCQRFSLWLSLKIKTYGTVGPDLHDT